MLRAPARRTVDVVAAAALGRTLYHLLDRHRVDDAAAFLDADFRGHGLGSDRAGFRAEAAAWVAAFPDLRISVHRLVADGSCVAAWIGLRGTHRGRFAGVSPTGRTIHIVGADLLVERNGRFIEGWGVRDLNALWIQLGSLPGCPRTAGEPNEERSSFMHDLKTSSVEENGHLNIHQGGS